MQKIFSLFRKKTPQNNTQSAPEGWNTPLKAEKLLDTPLRQQYLSTIWQNVSMTPAMFDELYRKPIEKYAEMVQLLPASESHHHAHLGGMLDHGLEVISIATKLRQSYVLPQNVAPEEQAKQRDVWTAVVLYAALVHDIGKVASDLEIMLLDGKRWFPWQGIPNQPYNFRYNKERDYQFHPILGSFFLSHLVPEAALNWVASFPQAFSQLIYFASAHSDKAGILGSIIQKADQFSVTMALGGDPNKIAEKPKNSQDKQYHIALRHVVQQLKLGCDKGGEAWMTGDGLWAMSRNVADGIRAYLVSQGISAPSQNYRVFDDLIAYNLIEKTSENTAIWFCKVTSQSGWTHDFSLVKIAPSIIWDSIEQHPPLFKGQVAVINKEGGETQLETNAASTDMDTSLAHLANSYTSPIDVNLDLKNIASHAAIEPPSSENISIEMSQVMESPIEDASIETVDDMTFALNLFPVKKNEEDDHQQNTESAEKTSPLIDETESANNAVLPESIFNVDQPQRAKQFSKFETTKNNEPNLEALDANQFVLWLKAKIASGSLSFNSPTAKLHIVRGHLFLVTPSIFQIYCIEVVRDSSQQTWEQLQKLFQDLGIHKRCYLNDGDSQNIWSVEVKGPRKTSVLKGYLIEDVKLFLGNRLAIDNQWISLKGDL